jgi:hypothetical protein
MSRTKKILIGIGGLLVVALLATGLWWAATPTGVSLAQAPSPTAPAAPTDQGTASETTQADATLKDQWAAYQEAFLNAFAARLGVTVEKLNEAYLGAFGDRVDQAVKDGVLTQDQGTQMKNGAASKVEQGLPFGFFGGRGFKDPSFGKNGRGGLEVGRGGFGGFHGAMHLDSFAEALNMTEADLMTELQNGKTLSDIAKEKTVDGPRQRCLGPSYLGCGDQFPLVHFPVIFAHYHIQQINYPCGPIRSMDREHLQNDITGDNDGEVSQGNVCFTRNARIIDFRVQRFKCIHDRLAGWADQQAGAGCQHGRRSGSQSGSRFNRSL